MPRRLRAPLAAALLSSLFVAVPGAAGATFCVGDYRPCDGIPEPSIQAAVSAAADAPGPDRVLVGVLGTDPGFTIAAGNVVDVVSNGDPTGIILYGNARIVVDEPAATIENLWFHGGGVATPLIDLRRGTWRGGGSQSYPRDPVVRLGNATLDGVQILNGTAVRAVGPGGLIKDSVLSGETALASSSDGLVVRRSRLEGVFMATPGAGAVQVTAGRVLFDGTDISASGSATGLAGVDVAPPAGGHAEVTLRGAMVHGEGQPAPAVGVQARCSDGASAAVTLVKTEVTGFGIPMQGTGSGCAVSIGTDDPPAPPAPPVPPAPPAPVVGAFPARPAIAAALLDHRLRADRTLRVRLWCRGATCRPEAVVLRAGTTTLGRTGPFTVAAGAVRTVRVAIGASARRRLRRHPQGLAVRVVVMKNWAWSWTNDEGGTVRP
ncbi:MAG TPA: hypothetical protein VNT55_06305 [Baekduia sp.]|nr:hypothetical protein [Baekduia sp.]